jgi:hypothetical protein
MDPVDRRVGAVVQISLDLVQGCAKAVPPVKEENPPNFPGHSFVGDIRRPGVVRYQSHGSGSHQLPPSDRSLFSGDVVYLVLIRGTNLDKPLADGSINLTNDGLHFCGVVRIREMTDGKIDRVGQTGPTIDSIEIAVFNDRQTRRKLLKTHAPAFLGDPA